MSLFDMFYRDTIKSSTQKVASSGVVDEFDNLVARLSAWALKEHNEDGTHNFSLNGNLVPIGAMMMWLTNTPPTHWLTCDGAQISRTTYQALFNVIGTTYGAGDGSTTFNVPDLRQRFPLGKAAAGTGSTIATTGGAIDHTHTGGAVTGSTGTGSTGTGSTGTGTTGNESGHTHTFSGTTGLVNEEYAAVNSYVGGGNTLPKDREDGGHTHNFSGTTAAGSAHNHTVPALSIPALSIPALGAGTLTAPATGANNPPYIVVNYIILAGV